MSLSRGPRPSSLEPATRHEFVYARILGHRGNRVARLLRLRDRFALEYPIFQGKFHPPRARKRPVQTMLPVNSLCSLNRKFSVPKRYSGLDSAKTTMNTHDEDLNLLIVFEAMMETLSVSKASERLKMSQPSMSHALARMRKAFGDPMFVRVKNQMQPTPRALLMAGPVKQALDLARLEIFNRPSFEPSSSDKTFTLCMTDVAEASYLPQVINAVRTHAPSVRLRTVSPIAEKLEEGLDSGAVDLAIGFFPDHLNAGVFQQKLLRNSGFVCLVGDQNSVLSSGKLTIEGFLDASHVAVRTEGRSQEVIEKTMLELNILRNVFLTIPHYLGLASIVAHTDLIAIIPMDLAAAFEAQRGMRILPLPFASPTVEVKHIWHKRFHTDPANQWLREIVRNVLQQR